MTKISRLSCMAATALILIFGNAVAADDAEAQPAKPDATSSNDQNPNPQTKEEADTKDSSSQNNTAKEEPGCD